MRITVEAKKALLWTTKVACGVLGLALFMWMPKTGKGILTYAALLVALIVIAIALAPKRAGYWPGKDDDP